MARTYRSWCSSMNITSFRRRPRGHAGHRSPYFGPFPSFTATLILPFWSGQTRVPGRGQAPRSRAAAPEAAPQDTQGQRDGVRGAGRYGRGAGGGVADGGGEALEHVAADVAGQRAAELGDAAGE